MEQKFIREQLYKRYIEPTKKREKFIGVEIELPIVNLSKNAVDFDAVYTVTKNFINHFNFETAGVDDEGNIYSAASSLNGDILSYDCSYNNLELSFGKESNLYNIQQRFNTYYNFLQNEFGKYNYMLTGMGVNPYRKYNRNVPIPNGRYRMLFHHLNSYTKYTDLPMYFHHYPKFGTFSSASQVQLDIEYEKLPTVLNTFSKLEPIKAILFSNSVLLDEQEDILCCRDMFWENSTHGINPHNIGMYDRCFTNIDDMLDYIETTSIYCVERDGSYINFAPVPISEYLNKSSVHGEYYENGEYKSIDIIPSIEDLAYLRTFKFEDLTFRGTVEFRSVCCQPVKDSMTVAAFHIGLMENLNKLAELLDKDRTIYHHGYSASELRKMFVKNRLPDFVDAEKLYLLARQILDIAYEGLSSCMLNEEKILQPLYKRIELRTNPARDMLNLRNQGMDLEDIIKKYGTI